MSMITWAAFLWMAGFVIGMGAVSVIESLGFLGQRSSYWTETTIRTHKVTKPLIWLGLGIAVGGGAWYYSLVSEPILQLVHFGLLIMMIANGSYLSFWISPRLLERERQGKSTQLLPKSWKIMITLSFFVSILTWWTALFLAMVVITRT